MKATNKQIIFYVSKVVEPIRDRLNEDNRKAGLDADWSNEKVDTFLKHIAQTDKSKIEMSREEMGELIINGFEFGTQLGLDLDYPKSELDDMLNFKDLK